MGTAASAPSISREQAKRICPPERWAEVEEKWPQLAEDDGTVSSPKAFVTASKLNLGIPGTTVDLSNVGVRALMRFTIDATGDIAAFAAQHAADAAASECATASFDTQDRATASFAEGRSSFASVDTAELSPKQVDAVRSLAGAVAPTKVSSARSPRPT